MALKGTPDIGNYPAYNSHSNLPGAPCSLIGFKRVFTGVNYQANDLKAGTEEKE